MTFEPVPSLTVRWRTEAGDGLEHVDLTPVEGGLRCRGLLLTPPEDGARAIRYDLEIDAAWRARAFRLLASDGVEVVLSSRESGVWTGPDGARLPALDGAVDLDLAGTPLTNLLPIRRIFGDGRGGAETIAVVYIPADTLAPRLAIQRYEALRPGRLYRYESRDSGFVADLPVDRFGLVVDYPGLWRRMPTEDTSR